MRHDECAVEDITLTKTYAHHDVRRVTNETLYAFRNVTFLGGAPLISGR